MAGEGELVRAKAEGGKGRVCFPGGQWCPWAGLQMTKAGDR